MLAKIKSGTRWLTSRCLPATKSDVQKLEKLIMATQADLDAVIDGLEAAIETALEAALAPVIAAIQAKAGSVDLSAEIAKLNAVAGDVSAKVAADLTPA